IPWPRGERPRLAGVSSFGFSGTNAHVILEEAPADASSGAHATPVIERPRHVFVASARTRTALRATADRLASHLTAHPEDSFADVCHTLAVGRVHFEHRLAVPAASSDEVVTVLRRVAAGEQADWLAEVPPNTVPKVAFLFTGQGAQYAGMARQLYESAPRFRAALDECASLLTDAGDGSLIAVLYPEAGRESPIDETRWTQPALFALEYALAMQWREWGIEPAVVLGHSVGEYVAATVAGALDLPDALRLVSARGRLMQALPRGGAMVAVLADEAAVSAAITPFAGRVAIAAI